MTSHANDEARSFGRTIAVVFVAFAAVTSPLWTAPFFGEDAMVISWLKSGGLTEGFADLTRPQYGLSSVRFYRPAVSVSLALQALVSTNEAWMRLANLTAFFVGIVGLCWIGRRQGLSAAGVAVTGLWMCAFPGGPGDWCWIVGRVDAFSFGFGMLGLSILYPKEGTPGFGRGLLTGACLFLACLSKESALAMGPAAAVLLWTSYGRSSWRAMAGALGGVALALTLRLWALDFVTGGYVGAPRPGEILQSNARLDAVESLGRLVFGYPAFAAAVLVVAPFAWILALGARARSARRGGFAAAAVLTLVPLLAGVHLTPAEATQSRLFPLFYAFSGLAWILAIESSWANRWLRAAAYAALLACPVLATVGVLDTYRAAGARIRDDEALLTRRIESAPAPSAADPSASPVLFAQARQGFPEVDPVVLMYNLGLDNRFSPPLGRSSRPVWPLRPALGRFGSEALKVPADDACMLREEPPHAGITLIHVVPATITGPSPIPETLTGADARDMERGGASPAVRLPDGPPGTRARAILLTPLGVAWTAPLTTPLDWKGLLTTPVAGTQTPLFHVLGFAVDYRAAWVLVRFEWVDEHDVPVARLRDCRLQLAPSFADYIRETIADPAFRGSR